MTVQVYYSSTVNGVGTVPSQVGRGEEVDLKTNRSPSYGHTKIKYKETFTLNRRKKKI